MRRLFVCLFLVLPAVGVSAPVPKSLRKVPAVNPLVGKWQGPEVGVKPHIHTFRLAADGTGGSNDPNGVEVPATYLPHPEDPKRLSWSEGGKDWECVYELDGDSMKIGFALARKQRRAELAFADCWHVFDLKRVKYER